MAFVGSSTVLRGWISPSDHGYFAFRLIAHARDRRLLSLYSAPPGATPRPRLALEVDTGFNGHLSMPASWIREFGLPYMSDARASFADGREIITPLYAGHVVVETMPGKVFKVDILRGTPLVGMGFIKRVGSRLTFDLSRKTVSLAL